MKKLFKLGSIILSLMMSVTVLGACSCSGDDGIDETKTQLYVFNYNGGYQSEWLYSAIKKYEELKKDVSFEDGKTGVQIIANTPKEIKSARDTIAIGEEVYFVENVSYRLWFNDGVFTDITKAVTDVNPYDNKKVEDKLSAEQKDVLSIDGKYYAIPHYSGGYGIIYDKDLFDQKGWYLKAGEIDLDKVSENFIGANANMERGTGPDGKSGTDDDGLPRTYDEFYLLCDKIVEDGKIPLSWPGTYNEQHLDGLMQSLIADCEGANNLKIRHGFNGEANDLGKIEGDRFVLDSTPTTITEANGYEVFRQAGGYYASQFIQEISTNSDYYASKSFSSQSQLEAQNDFLYSSVDGKSKGIAMLVDGDWWQQEADSTFSAIAGQYGEKNSKYNRHFGWLPLPKATAEKVGGRNVDFDTRASYAFVSKNIESWKMPLAIDFLQFVNSDEMLQDYSVITNTLKALSYPMTDDNLSKLTPFGKSLYNYKKSSTTDYAALVSSSGKFLNNQTSLISNYFNSTAGGSTGDKPVNLFRNKNATPEDYFRGNYSYWAYSWENLN